MTTSPAHATTCEDRIDRWVKFCYDLGSVSLPLLAARPEDKPIEEPFVTENEVVIPDDMDMCATHVKDAEIIQGRRKFFIYRDFGVEHASKGLMRVQTITAKAAMDKATGWHYHECGAQLIYVISGWVELSFEDGTTRRMYGGDVFFLPGGYVHNEITASDDYSALEVVVPGAVEAPGEMKTTACEAPESFLAEAPVG